MSYDVCLCKHRVIDHYNGECRITGCYCTRVVTKSDAITKAQSDLDAALEACIDWVRRSAEGGFPAAGHLMDALDAAKARLAEVEGSQA